MVTKKDVFAVFWKEINAEIYSITTFSKHTHIINYIFICTGESLEVYTPNN